MKQTLIAMLVLRCIMLANFNKKIVEICSKITFHKSSTDLGNLFGKSNIKDLVDTHYYKQDQQYNIDVSMYQSRIELYNNSIENLLLLNELPEYQIFSINEAKKEYANLSCSYYKCDGMGLSSFYVELRNVHTFSDYVKESKPLSRSLLWRMFAVLTVTHAMLNLREKNYGFINFDLKNIYIKENPFDIVITNFELIMKVKKGITKNTGIKFWMPEGHGTIDENTIGEHGISDLHNLKYLGNVIESIINSEMYDQIAVKAIYDKYFKNVVETLRAMNKKTILPSKEISMMIEEAIRDILKCSQSTECNKEDIKPNIYPSPDEIYYFVTQLGNYIISKYGFNKGSNKDNWLNLINNNEVFLAMINKETLNLEFAKIEERMKEKSIVQKAVAKKEKKEYI